MSTVALGTPDSNRDPVGAAGGGLGGNSAGGVNGASVGSVSSTPSLTIVSSPRVGTLIPNRVFVGGFPPTTFEHELKVFFEKFGAVKEVKIIRDPSGTSKGYGFVTYDTDDEAKKIQEMVEPLEFKGRHLNIGPAIRKTSSHFKTYDIVPQGAVLCSYGVPYALQNGITLVAATPETYAVAQPSQTAAATAALPYPIVMQQPMQQFIYPSVPLAAAAAAAASQAPPPTCAAAAAAAAATGAAITTQHQSANQAAAGQPCIAQHIQQQNHHASPTSPSKLGTLTYVYDGGASTDEHMQKAAAAAAPQTMAATFQPNMVSVLPNIGNLTLSSVAAAQQTAQYRLTTSNVAPQMAQYIYPNAAGYANMLQEITPYTTATNTYIHHPEYAELYPNGYDNYSEVVSVVEDAREQQQQEVMSPAKNSEQEAKVSQEVKEAIERYLREELFGHCCTAGSISLPSSPAASGGGRHRCPMHASSFVAGFACRRQLFTRNNNRYSPRKQQTTQQQLQQPQQYAGVSHTPTVGAAGNGRYGGASVQRNGRYAAKAIGGSPGCHKVVACGGGGGGGYDFEIGKADIKQPPGSVVTPPPTPITTESKG